MRDNAAAARALRADEYESRFLRSVESQSPERPRRRDPSPRAYGTRQGGPATYDGISGRRTVQITGQVAAPRPRATASSNFIARPDRTAMWAFILALFMVLMAVATAHAAV